MEYNSKDIEKKWQNYWSENQSFEPSDDQSKEKKYILYIPSKNQELILLFKEKKIKGI